MIADADTRFPRPLTRPVDVACDAHEADLKSGKRPAIEQRLADVPPAEREALLRELILLEVHYRCVSGETPTPDEYGTRFPDLESAWLERVIEDAAATSTPRRLGRFDLLERIGAGGFGTVWKAHDSELERDVALKILNPGRADPRADLDRFRREARAAGRLRHPGIATVHEACVVDGQPVLVQELVEGVSLRDLVRRCPLSFEQAAQLVAMVAEALDYAHEMGVIHRDVKPGNVIVHEGTQRPVVVDFGLARRDDAGETLTGEGVVLGTPTYMSPEQAQGGGAVVDRRSDVYALGVMLYELACGELPYRGSPEAVLDQVISGSMRRPRSVNARVPGDLETIILKAAARLPEERYPTARALADDLRRFLEGEPISARRHSALYVLRNSLRRHRVAVAVAGAFVVLLSASSIVVGVLAVRARREAATAEQVSQFLENIFQSSDPNEAKGEDPSASEIVDRGVKKLDAELATQPLVRARVQDVIGGVYLALGRARDAEPLLAKSLSEREAALGPDDLDVAATLSKVASAHRALERLDEAETEARRSLDIRERVLGTDGASVADSLHGLGEIAKDRGDYAGAERFFRRALTIHEATLGADDINVAYDLSGIAAMARQAGQDARASQLEERALRIGEKAVGSDSPALVPLLIGMTSSYCRELRWDEAEARSERALAIARKAYGEVNPEVARALSLHAELLDRGYLADRFIKYGPTGKRVEPPPDNTDRHAQVETDLRQALEIEERAEGVSSSGAANQCSVLARFLAHVDRTDEAVVLYQRALDSYTARQGLASDDAAGTLTQLARLEARIGASAEAEAHFRKAIEARESLGPEGSPALVFARLDLSNLLEQAGRRDEALETTRAAAAPWQHEAPPRTTRASDAAYVMGGSFGRLGSFRDARPCYENAVAIELALNLKENSLRATKWNGLGFGYEDTGCPDAAAEAYAKSIAVNTRLAGPESRNVLNVKVNLASALLQAGRPEEARVLCEELAAFNESLGEKGRANFLRARSLLADVLCALGRAGEGTPLVESVVSEREASRDEGLWSSLAVLGRCHLAQRRPETAEPLLRRAIELADAQPTPDPIGRARALESMSECLVALKRNDEAAAFAERARVLRESVAMPCP